MAKVRKLHTKAEISKSKAGVLWGLGDLFCITLHVSIPQLWVLVAPHQDRLQANAGVQQLLGFMCCQQRLSPFTLTPSRKPQHSKAWLILWARAMLYSVLLKLHYILYEYLDNHSLISYDYEFLTCMLSQTCVIKGAKYPLPLKSTISQRF